MPILVDTSVWVDFLRSGDADLEKCLEDERVAMHSMVLGELSLGYLRNRTAVLRFLGELPKISSATHEQVMAFVDTHKLAGRGIGWVDAHLLTAVARVDETQFWTRDKRLKSLAKALALAVPLP
ncbi:MAG: type II toxin-antitoxin system VapC family toxin [Elainellaceae cyanobacterium]